MRKIPLVSLSRTSSSKSHALLFIKKTPKLVTTVLAKMACTYAGPFWAVILIPVKKSALAIDLIASLAFAMCNAKRFGAVN